MKKLIAAVLALMMMTSAFASAAFAGHECQCKKPCQCAKCECPKK